MAHAQQNQSYFAFCIGIVLHPHEGIEQAGSRFFKRHAVFLQIARSFLWIELESHVVIVCTKIFKVKEGAARLSAIRPSLGSSAGVAVTVEIKTGKRRVIEYFLSPLLKCGSESLRER